MKKLFYLLILFPLLWSCNGIPANAPKAPQKPKTTKTSNTQKGSVKNFTDITVAQFNEMRKEKLTLNILDVRTPEEVEAGKIEGSTAIDFYGEDFQTLLGSLNRDQPTLVYCRSGGRSGKAMKMMQQMGFKEVYNLEGGFNEYSKH